jgi:hypothetical protein
MVLGANWSRCCISSQVLADEIIGMPDASTLPFSRNGVLFHREVDGKFVMLIRPSDTGHTPSGDTPKFVSPFSALVHFPTGRMAIYYCAAGRLTASAFARLAG